MKNKEQIDEIKANIENLKNIVKKSSENDNKLTQITIINKSDLKSDIKEKKLIQNQLLK